ncbi:MAG: CRISPR-associated endoribonuclease Cas6 [Candidatus Omnitrophica bacterium]|nr:CRISPR-associated endoribonuclease Cas6 [Candidatus Omnitrophota bacterium]
MRIRISCKIEKFPIIYRHRLLAIIKEALRHSDSQYKEQLYPDKNTELSKRTKPFTFSISLPKFNSKDTNCGWRKEKFYVDKNYPAVEELVFYFPSSSSLFWDISSSDNLFIINLYNGLLAMKEFIFDDLNGTTKITFENVFILKEHKINSNEVIFKTKSPITIEDKNGTPILPTQENLVIFNREFNAIHEKILKDLRTNNKKEKDGLYQELEFVPLKIKKQVVKHTLTGFREKTGKPYMALTTFEGCFRLKGDPRDLQFLYESGIGLRTGQGFGMVEVVR